MVAVLGAGVRKHDQGTISGYLGIHHVGLWASQAGVRPLDQLGTDHGNRSGINAQPTSQICFGLIDEWQLGRPHVVGPDVGTGAVLFAASEDLDRFPSAVVGSGGASFPLEVTGALKDIIEAPDFIGWAKEPAAIALESRRQPNELVATLLEANANIDL